MDGGERSGMNTIAPGAIRFLGYRVTGIHYACKPAFEFNAVENGNFQYNFVKSAVLINPRSVQINLVTNVFFSADSDMENAPYQLSVEIAGRFEGEDDWQDVWQDNALAILFPYARAIVSTITSQTGRDPIIIPTVNIVKTFAGSKHKRERHEAE